MLSSIDQIRIVLFTIDKLSGDKVQKNVMKHSPGIRGKPAFTDLVDLRGDAIN